MKNIKLMYIGGGSKAWARAFMNDPALTAEPGGEPARGAADYLKPWYDLTALS